MSDARWQRLQELFHQALPLDPGQRAQLLDRECAEDPELRVQVERLLSAGDRAGGFIHEPAIANPGVVPPDDEQSQVGRRVGAYRLVREIGRGGMGAVYLAGRDDGAFEQRVAIKLIKRGMDTDQVLARFRAERQILASLDHPNIARLLDGGTTDDGLPYFAMEYIEGRPIDAYAEAGRLGVEERLRLFLQVCEAVSYAHAQGVIHRDIKPLNTLVTAAGVPKLLDFGIAKVLHDSPEEITATVTGLRLLTPDYASPEQIEGRPATAASDVYSLGVVLYQLLTGRSPYRVSSRSPQEIAAAVFNAEPDRPSTAVSQPASRRLRGDLDTIVLTALRKEPDRRYASVAALADDIRRHLEGQPIVARADQATYRLGKFARRNRAVLVTAAFAVIGAVLVTAAGLTLARSSGASADPSLAVLPFDNLTGNPGDQYLSDGMTEEVIGQLAKVGDLKVISRTSTEALKHTRLTLRQIAETLGVRHILEGSVRHAANRIRVTVNLIDAHTDANVWSSAYDRDLADVFAVQEEIARQVADSLVSRVGVRPVLSRVARTGNPQAYEAYQVGRYQLLRRTGPGLQGAREKFEEAIAHDSAYAPALAGLASVYVLMGFYGYLGVDFYAAYGRAWWLADRAIAFEPDLAEGYATRGIVLTLARGPAAAIAADFTRALTLRPNSPGVHLWYSPFLSREDRHDESLAEAQRASDLDPLAPGPKIGLAYVGLAARRLDLVVREAARAAALEPGLMRPRAFQALGDLLSGHAERCLTQELGPNIGVRALCLHSAGKVREAALLADSLGAGFTASAAGESAYSPVLVARSLAQYYAWIGNAEESLSWLERAFALSPVGEDFIVIASAIYDRVRADPRFQAGLQRLNVQIYDRVQSARRAAEPM